jgi:hypothetical protein
MPGSNVLKLFTTVDEKAKKLERLSQTSLSSQVLNLRVGQVSILEGAPFQPHSKGRLLTMTAILDLTGKT